MTITISTPEELKAFSISVSKHTKLSASKLSHAIALSQGHKHVSSLFAALELQSKAYKTSTCDKCHFSLRNDGYCTSDVCRYSDWPQDFKDHDFDLLNEMPPSHTDYNKMIARRRIPIFACVHTDDRHVENDIDVREYFYNIDVGEYFYDALKNNQLEHTLFALNGCDFGGNHPADDVAKFFSDTTITDIFKRTDQDNGFGCHIEKTDVITWLSHYAPSFVENGEIIFKKEFLGCLLGYEFDGTDDDTPPKEEAVIVKVTLMPIAPLDELDELDKELPMGHIFTLSPNAKPENYADIALDFFHEKFPVSNLEHFEFTVTVKGKILEGDIGHESYTLGHLVLDNEITD